MKIASKVVPAIGAATLVVLLGQLAPPTQSFADVPSPAWTLAPVPQAGSNTTNAFSGVSCVNNAFCAAVGSFAPGAHPGQTLIQTYDGASWTINPSPNVGALENDLNGVSCVNPAFCVAVGMAFTNPSSGFDTNTLIEHYNGRTWSAMPSPNPAPGGLNRLYGVSCTTATYCVAVGSYDTGAPDTTLTLVEVFNGSSWSVMTSPNVGSLDNALNGVSCPVAQSCYAAGVFYQASGNRQTLVERLLNGAWQVMGTPNVPSDDDTLESISCSAINMCTAVGEDIPTNTTSNPLILTDTSGAWTIQPVPPQPSTQVALNGVSCLGGADCTTVGTYSNAQHRRQTLIMNEQNGPWRIQPSPNVGSGSNFMESVDCIRGEFCTAAGSNAGIGGAGESMILYHPGQLGYWLGAQDGGVFAFGTAPFYGSTGGQPSSAPMVAIQSTPTGQGYWQLRSNGGIQPFGDARSFGSPSSTQLTAPAVGMAASQSGQGYSIASANGGVYSYGDAPFYGSAAALTLHRPIVGMVSTPDGAGYWLVASDGGVFAYGDAQFYGSMGGKPLNEPIVAAASTPDGKGYWEVAADGGIFAFGDAGYYGSMGGKPLNEPVVGMAPSPSGQGYWLVASDGGIFTFGDLPFLGSTGSLTLVAPVAGMAVPY